MDSSQRRNEILKQTSKHLTQRRLYDGSRSVRGAGGTTELWRLEHSSTVDVNVLTTQLCERRRRGGRMTKNLLTVARFYVITHQPSTLPQDWPGCETSVSDTIWPQWTGLTDAYHEQQLRNTHFLSYHKLSVRGRNGDMSKLSVAHTGCMHVCIHRHYYEPVMNKDQKTSYPYFKDIIGGGCSFGVGRICDRVSVFTNTCKYPT